MLRILMIPLTFIIISASVGCNKNSDDNGLSVKKKSFELNSGDMAPIEVSSNSNVTYFSRDKYVAKVSSEGIITADNIGKTSIIVSDGKSKAEVFVTVKPLYDLFPEPIKYFSLPTYPHYVTSFYGTPSLLNDSHIVYSNYFYDYDYVFTVKDGSVVSATVSIHYLSLPKNLNEFLSERYNTVRNSNYQMSFVNKNRYLFIGVTISEDKKRVNITYSEY